MSALMFHGMGNGVGAASVGNTTAVQAYENGTLGLSFGGAGFLLIYYVGVMKVLEQLGIVDHTRPPIRVAGSSSGAITAGAICSGLSAERLYTTVTELTRTCRSTGCAGRMDGTVRDLLNSRLPADAARRCRGNLFAGVTVLENKMPRSMVASVVGEGTENRQDLIATLAASAYIPIWSGRSLFTRWRGFETADGSLSTQQPCPPGVQYCVRVSSRSPDMERPTMTDTIGSIVRALAGAEAAAARKEKPLLPAKPPPVNPAKMSMLQDNGLDIAPGLSVENAFDADTWNELGLIPCDPETCDYLYRLGQLDTMAWAEATGIAAAARRRKAAAGAAAAAALAAARPPAGR